VTTQKPHHPQGEKHIKKRGAGWRGKRRRSEKHVRKKGRAALEERRGDLVSYKTKQT